MRRSKDSTPQHERSPHLRYIELHKVYSLTKNKIKNLNDLEGKISQERYTSLMSKHEDVIKKTEPPMLSLKSEIEDSIAKKTEELKSISKKLEENREKIEESDMLLNSDIIEKGQYEKDTNPLFAEKSVFEADYNKKSDEISILKNALIDSGDDIDHIKKHLSGVSFSIAESPENKPGTVVSAGFFQRFSTSFVIIQIIALALFGFAYLSNLSNMHNAAKMANSIGIAAAFFFIVSYLIKGTNGRFITYLIASLVFIVLSIFISSRLWSPQFASSEIWSIHFWFEACTAIKFWRIFTVSKMEFLDFWTGWNMLVGIIAFAIAIVRTFLIGLRSEYGRRYR